MKELVHAFPAQLREALQIGLDSSLPALPDGRQIDNVLVSGLGGSGIGGEIVYDLCKNQLKVPFTVNKDYDIPASVGKNTLFIACSYSGNTEETLSALEQALERGALISAITSGGKLAELADEHGFGYIKIPGGMPPRACLGYSLVQQFFTLAHYGLIDTEFEEHFEDAAKLLEEKRDEISEYTKQLADELHDKTIVIYAPDGYGSIATRWRQQINENSKMLCWHHVLPEMNHNEILGWRDEQPKVAPFFFLTDDTHRRTRRRIELTKQVVDKLVDRIYEMEVNNGSRIIKAMYLSYVGDWLSVHLADKRGVDAVDITTIEFLKGELAKLG